MLLFLNKDLESMTIAELREAAKELDIKGISKYKKAELLEEIKKISPAFIEKGGVVLREKISQRPEEDPKVESEEKKEKFKVMVNESGSAKGVLEIIETNNYGFLRGTNYLTSSDDIYVSPSQIRRFGLRTGDTVSGKIRPPKDNERYFALLKVDQINYDSPDNAKRKILFENLTPLFAAERLVMEQGNGSTEDLTARVVDLCAPFGRGQRGLIVAPPKAGKTLMLQNIAHSIEKNYP